MNLTILFFFLFIVSITTQPISIASQPGDITIPVNIPFPETQSFNNLTWQISVTPPTNVIAELYLPSQPPHSGEHTPLITGRASKPSLHPSIESPCSLSQPCVSSSPFDDIAFYTRADTATISIPTNESKVFITVYNWRFPGLRGNDMVGTLYIRTTTTTSPPTCPGFARGEVCRGKGTCDTSTSRCICQGGWGGRSCGTRLHKAPVASELATWEGEVRPMKGSAVVNVSKDGIAYVWDIQGDGSRVEFRARILRGDVIVDGERRSVDGGGGIFNMVVKRGFANLGQGLEQGTQLPTLYDKDGVGVAVVKSGGVYEVVVVGGGVGKWVMGLMVNDGMGVAVSVLGRRCGGGGEQLDCAFLGAEEGGFSVGAVVGICVAAVVTLIFVVFVCLCCFRRRKKRTSNEKTVSGAWTDVEVSKIESV